MHEDTYVCSYIPYLGSIMDMMFLNCSSSCTPDITAVSGVNIPSLFYPTIHPIILFMQSLLLFILHDLTSLLPAIILTVATEVPA